MLENEIREHPYRSVGLTCDLRGMKQTLHILKYFLALVDDYSCTLHVDTIICQPKITVTKTFLLKQLTRY